MIRKKEYNQYILQNTKHKHQIAHDYFITWPEVLKEIVK